MKIVMIAPFSVYPKGTVPIRMLPLAKQLIERGNEVEIIVPPYDNISESNRQYNIEGVKINNAKFVDLPIIKYPFVLFSMLEKIIKSRSNCIYIFKPKGYSGLVAFTLYFFRLLGLYKNNLILLDTDDWEGRGGFADFFSQRSQYPRVMLRFFDFQERWIPKQVDSITVASRALELKLLSEGISEKKLFYLPNGKPQRSFDVPSNEVEALRRSLGLTGKPVVLLYTRFFEYKVEMVVDVFKKVKQSLPNAMLLVIGKGEFGEEKKLVKLASEERLGDSIVFGGWIAFNDIPKYLALGDVAIYPFDDTFLNRAKCPGKLIELMTAKRAIVASKVGQIKEYIQDGESGLLVEPGNNMQFASLIVKVLTDEDLKNNLSTNAKKRIDNTFNWRLLTDSVESAITQAKKRTQ